MILTAQKKSLLSAYFSSKKTSGFTMIELLVVIAIIAVLSAAIILIPATASKRARDSRRESDLKQYQSALEVYGSKVNNLYPARTDAAGATASTTLCSDLALTTCPEDPINSKDATYVYKYQTDGTSGSANATKYVLWTKLEVATNYFVVCSNGKTGTLAQTGWANPSAGTCPL